MCSVLLTHNKNQDNFFFRHFLAISWQTHTSFFSAEIYSKEADVGEANEQKKTDKMKWNKIRKKTCI